MKRLKLLIGLCIALATLSGCVDEMFGEQSQTEIPNGVVQLDLQFESMQSVDVTSRAAADSIAENRVNDVFIVLFRKNGKILKLNATEYGTYQSTLNDGAFVETQTDGETLLRGVYRIQIATLKDQLGDGNAEVVAYAVANSKVNDPSWRTGYGTTVADEFAKLGTGVANLTEQTFKTWLVYLYNRQAKIAAFQNTNGTSTSGVLTTDYKNSIINYEPAVERPSEALYMTGRAEQTLNLSQTTGQQIKVQLKRMDAKIEVRVQSGTEGLYVHPKRWRIHNVPVSSLIFEGETAPAPEVYYNPRNLIWRTFDYVGTVKPIAGKNKDYIAPVLQSTGKKGEVSGLVCYMPEVKLAAQKTISADSWRQEHAGLGVSSNYQPSVAQLYGLRARQQKNPQTVTEGPITVNPENGMYYKSGRPYTNGAFTFAPREAAWIEVVVNVEMRDANGVITKSAENAVYRLVLGGESTADYNSYTVKRDQHYIYNLTIKGFDDVEAEVKINNRNGVNDTQLKYEDNSGVDAHVNIGAFAQLDSHYDAKAILLNYYDLVKKYAQDDWAPKSAVEELKHFEVFTPYDAPGLTVPNAGKRDTSWVQFFVHRRDPNFGRTFPRFTLPYEYVRTAFPVNNSNYRYFNYCATPRELIHKLREWVRILRNTGITSKANATPAFKQLLEQHGFEPESGDMIISVYANEFYYETKPAWATVTIPTSAGPQTLDDAKWAKNGWRSFVNQPDRKIRIFVGKQGPLYSSDGYSSWNDADILITQHAIMAPYNLRNLPLDFTGFGAEMVDEAEWMDAGGPNGNVSRSRYCHVFNDVEYTPEQGATNIFDGRNLYLSLLGPGWLQGQRWNSLLDYGIYNHTDVIPTASKNNVAGYVYQPQIIFFREVYSSNGKRNGDWAGLAALTRNRETSELNNFTSATISNEDLKWYLPSLPQLEYLWMAEEAIPAAYHLKKDIPYLTSSRLSEALNQDYTECMMFHAKYGGTLRQRIVQASRNLFRYPYAWDIATFEDTRYYYGWNDAFQRPEWSGYQMSNKPLRIRAVRTLGGYNPSLIPRPAQRWIQGGGEFTGDTENGWDYKPIVIDCSRMPQEMLRHTPILSGPLPRHKISSMWARPYTYFRVAKQSVQAAKSRMNLDNVSGSTDGYDLTITDPEWQSIPGRAVNYRYNADASLPRVVMHDTKTTHPCKGYYEVINGQKITGWRLPNAQELMLMIRFIPPQQYLDLTTKRWSPIWETAANGYGKGIGENWSTNDDPTLADRKETLSNSEYNPAYLMSKTDTDEGYRFYGASFWAQQYGFRAKPMDEYSSLFSGTYAQRLEQLKRAAGGEIYNTRFDVRCVKDVTDAEFETQVKGRFDRDYWIKPF